MLQCIPSANSQLAEVCCTGSECICVWRPASPAGASWSTISPWFVAKRESEPRELLHNYSFSFAAVASPPLPVLPSPLFVSVSPSLSLIPSLLPCHRRDAVFRGTDGRLLRSSVTLATAASPALALSLPPPSRNLSSVTPWSSSSSSQLLQASICSVITGLREGECVCVCISAENRIIPDKQYYFWHHGLVCQGQCTVIDTATATSL